METLIDGFFNARILADAMPYLVRGLSMTLLLCAVALPLGIAGGLLLALGSTLRSPVLRWAALVYTDFFRAFPPLVLLLFIAYGMPFVGFKPAPFVSVTLAFFLNTSSYYGEILRAGLESVATGQHEAARSTGLSRWQSLRHVILPQAVKNVVPDLVSNTLEAVKLTSIASVVALPELLYVARQVQSLSYNASPVIAAGLIYLVLLWPLVRLLSRYERQAVTIR
ncbi:MAG: amino acid ABC transporter permease [Rubrivivax sp.]|jgi:polar amino acid transport system permease protein|nr:amino acid ABC transporter permease [Rubrivivax sp.]MBK7262405.1 amino acid ABC transporter permease [Rubrivivax sp.]MBK8528628.1 amino acid ABC transporter permease [Rubrivivax sp.]